MPRPYIQFNNLFFTLTQNKRKSLYPEAMSRINIKMYGLALVALFASAGATAETLSALARIHRSERRMEALRERSHTSSRTGKGISEGAEDEVYYPVIVKLRDEGAMLPDCARELHRRGRLVLAMVAEDRLDQLGADSTVERIEANMTASSNLVDAVRYCHVEEASASTGTPEGLTGRGVVVGLCDSGIQPNHATFLDTEGKSRFGKLVTWELFAPEIAVIESEEEIGAFETDNPEQTHATHVAGIMGGNGGGTAYRGIAPESEMVASAGPLADAYLLAGCEETIAYARGRGMPAVINMSISSSIGPHDGTTLFNQYMNGICQDATVCISAGNDGFRNGYVSKTLDAEGEYLRTYVREFPGWSAIKVKGTADIWSGEGESLRVDILCTDFNSDEVLFRYPAVDLAAGQNGLLLCSPELAPDDAAGYKPLQDGIEGYIQAIGEINPENGRMNVAVSFDYADVTVARPSEARYTYGIEVTGSSGSRIEVYGSDGIFFHKHWDQTAMSGNTSRSVNDFCCGEGPVSIGAMTSQNRNQRIDGEWVDYPNLTVGDVTYFSSYGTLNDGTVLPHIVAPGAQTISAMSTAYLTGTEGRIEREAALKSTLDGKEYYWGSKQGTSMSAPFAAGVFALWLEEDPTLTPQEIKQIAIESADIPETNADNPQWGRGILNAAKGLEAVRDRAGTGMTKADGAETGRLTALGGGRFRLCGLGEGKATARVTDPAGVTVMTAHGSGEGLEIDLGGVQPGVYIIIGEGERGAVRGKVAVRP